MTPWQSPEFDAHEQVCAFSDPESGLQAIVAVHSTARGPAAGGTRFWPYKSYDLALDDVLRLSRAMSYKCALAGVAAGGGKAVIVGDPARQKTKAMLHAYGRYLNRIGQIFATGEDVGFSVADCETIREVSPYIAGTESAGAGDPSVHTALGVFHGLRAVLMTRFDRDDFTGVHLAIQGLGNVGWNLAKLLHQAGARLTVADIRRDRAELARTVYGANVVDSAAIHAVSADIYAPCALGGVINGATIEEIRAKAVAGAANNQLATRDMGRLLCDRGILYAPDYVINAGGVIGAAEELARMPGRAALNQEPLDIRLTHIQARLLEIFERSAAEATTPEQTADRMACELIGR